MTIPKKAIDAVVLHAVELVASGKKPSIKVIRTAIEGILTPNNPTRHDGLGRETLRPYIVARCYIQSADDFARGRQLPDDVVGHPHVNAAPTQRFSGWDNQAPEIRDARAKYDAGTHDMIQARDGNWLIMYSIPRSRPPLFHGPYFDVPISRSHH